MLSARRASVTPNFFQQLRHQAAPTRYTLMRYFMSVLCNFIASLPLGFALSHGYGEHSAVDTTRLQPVVFQFYS